ncbi:MAG: NUDIX hydrolase [Gammaproteobacteria bacterium]|nr:NUDIX hydrolase [Gammaproteobacteria bacterium]
MNFCSNCGQPVAHRIPPDDNRERAICDHCDTIHYQNPLIVAGCVPDYKGSILLCKRAIEPRAGYWTVPAGFMELDETVAEAAAREALEEAEATVTLGPMIAMVNVLRANQVHIFFSATLDKPEFGVGEESLATELFAPDDIPWDEISFPSVRIALEQYLQNKQSGRSDLTVCTAPHQTIINN